MANAQAVATRRERWFETNYNDAGLKKCRDCGEFFQPTEENFYKATAPDGLDCRCRPCAIAKVTRNRDKTKTAHRIRLKKYGITPEQFEEMVELQGGRCLACWNKPGKRGLYVDHCHRTGRVRGLLCHNCNTALGLVKDKTATLKRMISYLEGKA